MRLTGLSIALFSLLACPLSVAADVVNLKCLSNSKLKYYWYLDVDKDMSTVILNDGSTKTTYLNNVDSRWVRFNETTIEFGEVLVILGKKSPIWFKLDRRTLQLTDPIHEFDCEITATVPRI
jgi:hypothetical protein